MIDCDIHNEIGDVEEFLSYVSPSQRRWFRGQHQLGLPGYPWSHPHSFYRDELEEGPGGEPASRIDLVQREVLDAYEVDAGLLTGDVGVAVSLMPNPYRAAEFARAHNDWLADRWLDAEPRLRGSILVPAQDPLAAAAEIERLRRRSAVRGGAAGRRVGAAPTASRGICRSSQAAADCRTAGRDPLRRRGHGDLRQLGRRRLPELLHRVAHAGVGVQHHGAPGLADLPRHVRARSRPAGADDGGRPRLAAGDHVAAGHQLAGAAGRGAVADRRPSEVLREHIRFTTQPLEHTTATTSCCSQMLEAVGAPEILCFASDYPALGLRPTRPDDRAAPRRVARAGHARQRGASCSAPGSARVAA